MTKVMPDAFLPVVYGRTLATVYLSPRQRRCWYGAGAGWAGAVLERPKHAVVLALPERYERAIRGRPESLRT
jgi:hypothetical protein